MLCIPKAALRKKLGAAFQVSGRTSGRGRSPPRRALETIKRRKEHEKAYLSDALGGGGSHRQGWIWMVVGFFGQKERGILR